MSVRIKTNIESLVAQKGLETNRQKLRSSLEKLSSGKRINKSVDDVAGLAISNKMDSRTRSLEVAKRNASDGISYLLVAEGGLNEVTNNIIRMRELVSQSASDTISNRERGFLDKEFQQLSQEVSRIIKSTQFNGAKLYMSEHRKPMRIFVGASDRADATIVAPTTTDPDTDPDVITIDFNELFDHQEALGELTHGGLSVLPDDLESGSGQDLGPDGTNALFYTINTSLNGVASFRASLGAVQTRLHSAITTIEVTTENLRAANSRICDVDYAAQTEKFAQAKILLAAGASVLAQVNSMPEIVLQRLLG